MYQTFNEIGIINQLAESFLRRVLPEPLTIAQFHVLTHLTRLPGSHTPTQITKAFQVTKGAMTHTLGLLSKNGLVTITPDLEDGRSKHVNITCAGQNIYRQTIEKLTPYFAKMALALPKEDVEIMTKTLGKIRILMDEARDLEIK